jgi:hypothetical protein
MIMDQEAMFLAPDGQDRDRTTPAQRGSASGVFRVRLRGRITLALVVPLLILVVMGVAVSILTLGAATRAEAGPRDTVQRFFQAWSANDESAMRTELHPDLRVGYEGLVLSGLTRLVIENLSVQPLDATFQLKQIVGDEATVLAVFVATKSVGPLEIGRRVGVTFRLLHQEARWYISGVDPFLDFEPPAQAPTR